MKYPAYPDYSRTRWPELQIVPSTWETRRLKFVLQRPVTDGPHTTPEFTNEGVPFLSVDSIQAGELTFEQCRFVSQADHDLFSKKAAPQRGDVLLGKAASTGKIAQVKVDFPFSIWSPLALLRPHGDQVKPAFLEFALKSSVVQAQIQLLCTFNTQSNISMDDIPRLVLPLPPIAEQEKIADFLDWRTAQIDALIAKKQSLLERLTEKRVNVIASYVTNGLVRQIETRPSGAAWFAQVPKHWHVKRIKFIGTVGNGSTPARDDSSYWNEGNFPWLNSSVANQEAVTEAEQFVTPLALKECHLPIIEPPTVLVGITGQGKTRGMATTLMIRATINQHLAYIKPVETECEVRFLRRVFDATYAYLRNESDGGGSTKGAITCEQIAELPVPVPPLEEQQAIADHIDKVLDRINRIADKATDAIERLTEYRSALITAAVTGEIDVRGVQVPAPA